MKTIGLIGGMSWESTVTYYQIINTVIKQELGGLHSAKCILYSVDFQEIEHYQAKGDWAASAKVLQQAGKALEVAGADFIIICTNTMHKIADKIQEQVSIPIIHIAECTADKLLAEKINTVALLGTKYTMQQDFYKQKLVDKNITVLIPDDEDIKVVNDVIYNELCLGKIAPQSKEQYLKIIDKLHEQGAQGVILGCTEIGLLLKQSDTKVPLFDTTYIHAQKAAMLAIQEDKQ